MVASTTQRRRRQPGELLAQLVPSEAGRCPVPTPSRTRRSMVRPRGTTMANVQRRRTGTGSLRTSGTTRPHRVPFQSSPAAPPRVALLDVGGNPFDHVGAMGSRRRHLGSPQVCRPRHHTRLRDGACDRRPVDPGFPGDATDRRFCSSKILGGSVGHGGRSCHRRRPMSRADETHRFLEGRAVDAWFDRPVRPSREGGKGASLVGFCAHLFE